ncbi:hypothetical protein J1N35_024335 [Gossypium stocksii]|uniref:Uncharacterized protein n=1 Tax=Gossypium stocksii TaxID=47602 RepID=A0A9D3V4H5_9ROSI|nr:hypothetical protein J1N35_024335 [Gossypium stocksii]
MNKYVNEYPIQHHSKPTKVPCPRESWISSISGTFKYELFNVKGELELEAVINSHCLSGNAIMELYVEFVKVDGFGPSLTNVAANAGTEVEAKSPTTQLYGGFTVLLQSSHYNVLKS